MMAEVIKDLLIGDQASVAKATGVKYLVSVVNYKPEVPKGMKCLHINIEDSEDVNLLEHLPKCIKAISKVLSSNGRVLVHCHAGTSRSVAVVTAYLMADIGLPLQDALNAVKASAPAAAPNSGFMEQLQLWEDMGCRLNEKNAKYKRFKLEQVGKRWQQDGYVDPVTLPKLPEDKGPAAMDIPEGGLYRCRKCRRLIATASHIIPVESHQGKKGFRDYKSVKGHTVEGLEKGEDGGDESSLFVQPMAWMGEAVMGVVQGKLYCPGCNSRLGSFNWSGITDTSGAWVTPAFQLHISKMDHILRRPPEALNAIRRPVVLPSATASSSAQAAPVNLRPPVIPLSRQQAASQGPKHATSATSSAL